MRSATVVSSNNISTSTKPNKPAEKKYTKPEHFAFPSLCVKKQNPPFHEYYYEYYIYY